MKNKRKDPKYNFMCDSIPDASSGCWPTCRPAALPPSLMRQWVPWPPLGKSAWGRPSGPGDGERAPERPFSSRSSPQWLGTSCIASNQGPVRVPQAQNMFDRVQSVGVIVWNQKVLAIPAHKPKAGSHIFPKPMWPQTKWNTRVNSSFLNFSCPFLYRSLFCTDCWLMKPVNRSWLNWLLKNFTHSESGFWS